MLKTEIYFFLPENVYNIDWIKKNKSIAFVLSIPAFYLQKRELKLKKKPTKS